MLFKLEVSWRFNNMLNNEEQNNGFGEIPKKRGNSAAHARVVLFLLYISAVIIYRLAYSAVLFSTEDIYLVCGVLFSLVLEDLLHAAILYAEEKNHIASRYHGSRKNALKACLTFSTDNYHSVTLVLLITFISTGVTLYYWLRSATLNDMKSDLPFKIAAAFVSSVVLHHFSDLLLHRGFAKAEISNLNETENKHVADGLAWSYYFGYLKLILPSLGSTIDDAIKPNFECEGVDIRQKIAQRKVFVVIPKDCYCYGSFTKADKRITFAKSMPELRVTRGGVQERVYKNSLWKISLEEKEPIYLMMEYATPVLSMYDMTKERLANFEDEDLAIQVKEFASKLKQILDSDPECRGKFQLVLLEGCKSDLADIIYRAATDPNIEI